MNEIFRKSCHPVYELSSFHLKTRNLHTGFFDGESKLNLGAKPWNMVLEDMKSS